MLIIFAAEHLLFLNGYDLNAIRSECGDAYF